MKLTRNILAREVLVSSSSLGVMVGDVVVELSFVVLKGMRRFGISRGLVEVLIIRGKVVRSRIKVVIGMFWYLGSLGDG